MAIQTQYPPLFKTSNTSGNPPTDSETSQGIGSKVLNAVKSTVGFMPRWGAEEAVQGLANRTTNLLDDNQSRLASQIQDLISAALLRRIPDKYLKLLSHIQAFLRAPSTVDLEPIQEIIMGLRDTEIQAIFPNITGEWVDILLRLNIPLTNGVDIVPPVTTGLQPTLRINDGTRQQLERAAWGLEGMIKRHEGVLLQTMGALTEGISAPDGPIAALRDQLNNPERGVLTESFRILRKELTARASPELREAKNALEAYRTAMSRNVSVQEITPLTQGLQTKLTTLHSKKDLIPQINCDQWVQIGQFHSQLRDSIANPNVPPQYPALLASSEGILSLITKVFNEQRGMIEEAADILVEGIGRGVEQLVPLPARMMQGVFSSPPQGPSSPSIPSSAASEPTMSMGNILLQGQGMLSALLQSAGSGAAKIAASGLGALLCLILEKLKGHIQANSREHMHLLQTIDPLMIRLRNPNTQNSWGDLTSVLGDALRFMQDQQIYFQGFRLPIGAVRNHTSAIPGFLNNINTHQDILRSASHRNPEQVTPAMIQKQIEHLKARSTSFGPAQLTLERICGLNASAAVYAEIYGPSLDPLQADLTPVFRQRLFDHIDRADLNFIMKWVAKRIYDISHVFSAFYVCSMMDNIFKTAADAMKPDLPGQASKDELFINLARNWMAVMSGAYNHVAASPSSSSEDFNIMMEKALKLPERNGGLNQQQLYAAVAKTALDKFGPSIAWTEAIDQYFRAEIPSDSSFYFLNPVAKILSKVCSFCLQGIVFIPQWIGNQILKGGAKLALSHTPFIKDYSEKMIESLRRNTPASYALHRMIYARMQKVLLSLQQNLNSEEALSGNVLSRNTNIKTLQIEGLVRYSMEVLNKGQYRTQDSLRDYLNHSDPLRHRIEHELENTFLPEVMPTAIQIISIAMETMTNEKEMQEMFYSGLQMANDVFNDTQPVSDADFAAVENGIRNLTDQILQTAIRHTVEEKFDFTNEKQKRGISHFFTTLKTQSQQFTNDLSQKVQTMTDGNHLADSDIRILTYAMVEASAKFNKERVDALGKVEGNGNFHTETKYQLNDLSRHLSDKCTPLSRRLNAMKIQSDEMLFCEKVLNSLLDSSHIYRRVEATLRSSQPLRETIPFYKQQIAHLQEHLTTLRQNECSVTLEVQIRSRIEELTVALQGIEPLQAVEETLSGAALLFQGLKTEKLARMGYPPSPELMAQEKRLIDLLNTLPFPDQKTLLIQEVRYLTHCVSPEGMNSGAQRFNLAHAAISTRNTAEKNTRLEIFQRARTSFQAQIENSIQEYARTYSEKKRAFQAQAGEVNREVNEINAWAQGQHDLPIWNIFAFDMQWVTENIKNLAFDRAKAKVQLLFDALYQKHNYVGFVNQVALLPFLEHCGKHHLQNQS